MKFDGSRGWQFRYSGTQASLFVGLFLIVLGLLFVIGSDLIEWIFKVFGYIFIVLGIVALAMGVLNWLSQLRRPRV